MYQLVEDTSLFGVTLPAGTIIEQKGPLIAWIKLGADFELDGIPLPRNTVLQIARGTRQWYDGSRTVTFSLNRRAMIGDLEVEWIIMPISGEIVGMQVEAGDWIELRRDGQPHRIVLATTRRIAGRDLERGDHVYVMAGRIQYVEPRQKVARLDSCIRACGASVSCHDWCRAD